MDLDENDYVSEQVEKEVKKAIETNRRITLHVNLCSIESNPSEDEDETEDNPIQPRDQQ